MSLSRHATKQDQRNLPFIYSSSSPIVVCFLLTVKGKYDLKFKAEALPLKDQVGGFRLLFSHAGGPRHPRFRQGGGGDVQRFDLARARDTPAAGGGVRLPGEVQEKGRAAREGAAPREVLLRRAAAARTSTSSRGIRRMRLIERPATAARGRVAMKVLDRLREDSLLGVRFAVNVFIASIFVWITLRFFTDASPIWAIASMIASSEPVVKQGLKMFRSRLINTLVGCAVGAPPVRGRLENK